MYYFGSLVSTLLALTSLVIANPIWPRSGAFTPTSPTPKVPKLHILKRSFLCPNAWTSGFIGNKAASSPASYGSTSSTTGGSTGAPPSYGQTGLTSYQQNGYSSWGTFNQPSLPKYASYSGGGHGSTGVPGGGITTTNANPYPPAPKTGGVRRYEFTVPTFRIKPDGVVTRGAVCVMGR